MGFYLSQSHKIFKIQDNMAGENQAQAHEAPFNSFVWQPEAVLDVSFSNYEPIKLSPNKEMGERYGFMLSRADKAEERKSKGVEGG